MASSDEIRVRLQGRRVGPEGDDLWTPIPFAALLGRRRDSAERVAAARWVMAGLVAACIVSSVGGVMADWNGIPLSVGPFTFYLTLYPPLILCTWALLWLGFTWAFLAAYVATLVGALVAGMPVGWALLFGLADPLGLAVYALAYRTAPLPIRMRRPAAVFWFVAISLVAALAGSSGSFIWSHTQALAEMETFAVWQGWWMGAFMQAVLINLPVLAVAGVKVEALRQRRLPVGSRPSMSPAWNAGVALAFFMVIGFFLSASGALVMGRLAELRSRTAALSILEDLDLAVWSLGLITWHGLLLLGVGAIGVTLLAIAWNRSLQAEVRARTFDLERSRERYALAAEGANDGLWDWDLGSGRVYFATRWKRMLGWGERDLGDRIDDWVELTHPEDREQLRAALTAHVEGHTSHFECEHRVRHRDGTYRWMLARGLCVRDDRDRAVRMAGSQTDITERRTAEEQLVHDALHDHLTGLPNRALLLDRVAGALARSTRNPGYQFSLLFLDLDRFKTINDSLGHAIGDRLLVAIAERLRACLRPIDTVARLGGDEFAILLDDITTRNASTELADRIHDVLTRPFYLDGNEVFTSASIGIASSRTGYHKPDDVLRDADTAMYRAKNLGKARHQVFDTAMHAHAMRQLLLETDLRRASERGELHLLYQPLVRVSDRSLCGFEALLRWNHPRWGAVPQIDFLALAEESGLIVPIGEWVLENAARQLAEWRRAGMADGISVSINLSPRQLMQTEILELVRSVLERTDLEPALIRLEITEHAIMENVETATAALRALKAHGVAIDIDDFGTGYSSLSHLHHFPIDRVKIDRSFVGSMLEDGHSMEIVRAIVGLAANLGLEAVAEGVETEPQWAALRDLGCPLAQGFLIDRPLEASVAAQRLRG